MTHRITEKFILNAHSCACSVPAGKIEQLVVLCGWHMDEMFPKFAEELPEALFFFSEADGSRDFTPWEAPAVWDSEAFSGGSGEYLHFLLNEALPYVFKRYGFIDTKNRLIAGYSLGGLFALWASLESGMFGKTASLSGSAWYPGFTAYFRDHLPDTEKSFYFSLGDREPFGGPPALRAVGVCTEELVSVLQENRIDVTFEWNRGGHYKGIEDRWRKALRWAAAGWKGSDV